MTLYAPDSDELTGGQWVDLPGGLRKWQPDDPDAWAEMRRRDALPINARDWGDDRVREAHAAYIRGERDLRTEAGNREWNRRYKARKRAEQRQRGAA